MDVTGLGQRLRASPQPLCMWLRLLSLIAGHAGGDAWVRDLTGAFELTGPTISHHLKARRETGPITGNGTAAGSATGCIPESWSRLW